MGNKHKWIISSVSVLIALALSIMIGVLSPRRYPEPMVENNSQKETIESLRHIYGRTIVSEEDVNKLTLTVNLNFLNRWRAKDFPVDIPLTHTRSVIITKDTQIIPYNSDYAAYFPLNTFPYTPKNYTEIYQEKNNIPTDHTLPMEKLFEKEDQGITVIAAESPYLDTDPLIAQKIILWDKDFQDAQGLLFPFLYLLMFIGFSIPFGVWITGRWGMIVRLSLVILAISWYALTSLI